MVDIAENPETGERVYFNGSTWAPLPNKKAPGFQYLTENFTPGDKSEAAGFRVFKDKDNTAQAGATTGIRNARRLEGLLAKQKAQGQGTGGIYSIPVIGGVAGWLDPEIREMDSIQSESARSKRQPGEGAISDFDAQQFLNMTPGRDKPLETNRALIQAQRVADDAVKQRRQFMEWHMGTYGHTNGAVELWDRYAQDNPIFDPASESAGKPILNQGRTNWREWVGVARSDGDKRPTEAARDAQRSTIPAELRRAPPNNVPTPKVVSVIEQMKKAGEWNERAPRGSSPANPFVAVNPSIAKKLPKGSFYLDAEGNLWQQ